MAELRANGGHLRHSIEQYCKRAIYHVTMNMNHLQNTKALRTTMSVLSANLRSGPAQNQFGPSSPTFDGIRTVSQPGLKILGGLVSWKSRLGGISQLQE